ncbi:MAG TPA: hypothetical protein VET87_16335 [Rubrivivax sp.]|nr:hypothetical protein [Rubrivivax sp.]
MTGELTAVLVSLLSVGEGFRAVLGLLGGVVGGVLVYFGLNG